MKYRLQRMPLPLAGLFQHADMNLTSQKNSVATTPGSSISVTDELLVSPWTRLLLNSEVDRLSA